MKYYLDYEPQGELFYVADFVLKACEKTSEVPLLELSPQDYARLGCFSPVENAPVVGYLMGRDGGNCFSAQKSGVAALAKTGFKIRFLTYKNCQSQLENCNGLVLPDNALAFPDVYYVDSKTDKLDYPSRESDAYVQCLSTALERQIPVLAIGRGALMTAGAFGLKLYRSADYIETPIKHNTRAAEAHRLNVFPQTPLARLWGNVNLFYVNSRHKVLLAPLRVQNEIHAEEQKIAPQDVVLSLDIYAEASDGVPEAWGSEPFRLLCVQWHPEDMAVKGDEKMQRIYQWLADELKASTGTF